MMSTQGVEGILVGHATGRTTGATVVLCPGGAVAGVDVRGGATGSRELDPCLPGHLVQQVHGICLAGGSAFGLAAAGGAMRWLEEQGIGYPTRGGVVPIVPGAILYDLALGDPAERPDAEMGHAACVAAAPGLPASGSVGAGRAACVGKLFGLERAVKGGTGVAERRRGELAVAAVAAVNAFGDVVDPRTGEIVAGARDEDGGFADSAAAMAAGTVPAGFTVPAGPGGGAPRPDPSTTLVVLFTNAALDRPSACRMAAAGSLGVARAVRPVHTRFDGDIVFTLATGAVEASQEQIGALAAEVTAEAILDGVRQAEGLEGVPAVRDLA
jgi:L-aminopeptidase/D-esterase-like protein